METYIPFQRWLLKLCIDGRQTIRVGRFMMRKSALRESGHLRQFAGYQPIVIDTKNNEEVPCKQKLN